jgi:hypothetical protein
MFSENLKADLLGTSVRVTVIEPGMADTEFSLVWLKHPHASLEGRFVRKVPPGKATRPSRPPPDPYHPAKRVMCGFTSEYEI